MDDRWLIGVLSDRVNRKPRTVVRNKTRNESPWQWVRWFILVRTLSEIYSTYSYILAGHKFLGRSPWIITNVEPVWNNKRSFAVSIATSWYCAGRLLDYSLDYSSSLPGKDSFPRSWNLVEKVSRFWWNVVWRNTIDPLSSRIWMRFCVIDYRRRGVRFIVEDTRHVASTLVRQVGFRKISLPSTIRITQADRNSKKYWTYVAWNIRGTWIITYTRSCKILRQPSGSKRQRRIL